jgi:putative transposase
LGDLAPVCDTDRKADTVSTAQALPLHDDERSRPARRGQPARPPFEAHRPNQRWVGDVSKIVTGQGKLYLAVILELFSRMIVGWALSAANDRHLALRALEQALRRRCPRPAPPSHQSGQPVRKRGLPARARSTRHHLQHEPAGNAHDNAAMESWFSTMTFELGDRFETHAEAKTNLFDCMEAFYNQERRHPTLRYLSPAQLERAARMEHAAA